MIDEDENENDLDKPLRVETPADKFSFADFGIAGGLGLLIIALLSLWPFPGLVPDAWQSAAVAAGLRPPAEIFPGFWRLLTRGVFHAFGIDGGTLFLRLAGRVCLGFSVACVYLFLRMFLTLATRLCFRFTRNRFYVIRVAALLSAFFFGCADPVWRTGQTFAPVSLSILITVAGLALFFSFIQTGRLSNACFSMVLLGGLSAETPAGLLVMVFCWGGFIVSLRFGCLAEMNLTKHVNMKWTLTFLYVFGLVIGITLNCLSFTGMDGLAASGLTGGDMPQLYVVRYWSMLCDAASLPGWVLGIGLVVVPFMINLILLPYAADEEQFLPYHVGLVFLVTGLISFSQLAWLNPLWFWTWITHPTMVGSAYFLNILILIAVTITASVLVVFGVDVFCRDHDRLMIQRYADLQDESDSAETHSRFGRVFWRVLLALVPILLLAAVIPGRRQVTTRKMLTMINDYAAEVLSECGTSKWIFTDGSFDCLLEFGAAQKGKTISALSMISENAPWDVYVRGRGITDAEDRLSLVAGAPALLRTWMRDRPERLKDVAIQLGFELWKRDGKELPLCSGVLSRPIGMDAAACAQGVEASRKLAKRLLDLYTEGGPAKGAGTRINDLILFVQWRLSRLARMRAERADRAGDTASAMADVKLSDDLDRNNASLKHILEGMEKMRQLTLRQMTPREGLQLALVRADFALARRYAEPILEADPENADANFGVGMSYFTQGQYFRAETYLRRCLVRNPNEPAVYNNLAVIQLKTGRYDAAERNARKALSYIPNSAEVKDTLLQIQKARAGLAPIEKTPSKAK